MKKQGRAELATTISSMIMAAIAGGSILTILNQSQGEMRRRMG